MSSADEQTTLLVTGPARSGKSEWAERLAHESGRAVWYLATARENPDDAEWTARLAAHRHRRPAHWITHCEPTELAAALLTVGAADDCVLIDSLGTWVANLLELDDARWSATCAHLFEALAQRPAALVIAVAEETGWGVIPAYPQGRLFRDRLGALVRRLGPQCAATYLVTGGYALDLRRLGVPIDRADA